MAHSVIPKDHPKYPAIRRRMFETWAKTILGFGMMGGLIGLALWAFGTSTFHLGIMGAIWLLLPIVMWALSAKVSLLITKSQPADPNNPTHARLIKLVHEVWLESGLKHEPPVYVSPNPAPNAFATGPIHRFAVVAATDGLFNCGMTDDEIKAVFAHEFGHVKNYDVGINSMIAVLSSLFFLITDSGIRALLGGLGWIKNGFGLRRVKRPFLPGIVTNILMYAIFWATGQVTKVIQLFVVRSRESGADATGADMTGKPCDLANALLKLVAYVEKNRPKPGRDLEMWRGMRVIGFIDPLFDATTEPKSKGGVWEAIKAIWRKLQLTHPPVPERCAQLERMNGGKCPAPTYPAGFRRAR